MRPLYLRLSSIVLLAGLGLAVTGAALVPAAVGLSRANTSSEEPIDLGPLDQRSYVLASDGSVLATLRAEIDRQPVPLEQIPQHTIDAVLAVEDSEFFIHDGVNLRATLRALVRNFDEGETVQGGSTITQQLVKAELVGDADTIERKAREAVLARRLEASMTKAEILERYLNTVYFGNGAYGVQAAAETYFGHDVGGLDLVESAFLAGLIANPSAFDPIRNPEASLARRGVSLTRLVDLGRLTRDEADELAAAPLPTQINQVMPTPDSYFVEEVKQQLLDDSRLGGSREEREAALFRGGLRIHTTLDPRAQAMAITARNDVLAEVSPEGTRPGTTPLRADARTGAERYATAAVVSVEPETGAIRAMVGGPGFADEKVNLATGRGTGGVGRSGGSSFKVFVLMALLENGFVPTDSVNGAGPCVFQNLPGLEEPYVVNNFDGSAGGPGTIHEQTLRSSNCAYVRLGQIVGIDEVVEQARKMGITTDLDEVVSMPLGTKEVIPLEMASAFGAIAADGVHHEPYYIERVEGHDGRTVFHHEDDQERASSVQSARLAADILEANVRGGTGTRARIPGQHAAGKTGTAQDSGDGWFVGFTPYLSTAVWIGSPADNDSVVIQGRAITGGSFPAEIWGRYMRAWHEGLPERDYKPASGTRAGRFLLLPPEVDAGGLDTTTTTLLAPFPTDLDPFPFPFPTNVPPFTFPNDPGGGTGGEPGGTTGGTGGGDDDDDDPFPPGFPFND